MEKIYVFGHRNPDTDSITAAISLSYLKQQLGLNTIPVTLSNINNETKFALKYFNVKEPIFLNDIKFKLKDVKYKKNLNINICETLINAYNLMIRENSSKLSVVDNNKMFLGILALKDIAKYLIEHCDGELNTTYDNIKDAINGKEIVKIDNEIIGKSLTASYRSNTFIDNIELDQNSILIIGDRDKIIDYAINNKVKLIILTGDAPLKDESIELAKINEVNIIRTSFDTLQTVQRVQLSNRINILPIIENVARVTENDNLDDFIHLANKTKFSYFPVINKKGKSLGIISLSDTYEKTKKKVILVDHNSKNQTIEGIEDAEIIEMVDHHNIGNLATNQPINFRNMPVGSTNTIIYKLFEENDIEIPSYIAGLMASGIISDTLLLKSPTTTKLDEIALEELAKIANINFREYGLELLKAGASIDGKTKEELLYQDFKTYPIDNDKILAIGQISTTDPSIFLKEKDKYIELINDVCNKNNYYVLTFFVSDILNNGSYILFNEKAKDVLSSAFDKVDLKQGDFLKDIISRKLQVVPKIMDQFNE